MSRYIFREVAVPFGLALILLVSLLLLQRIIQITDWVVNRGISLTDMIIMVCLLLPFFLVMIIPMALLLATLLAVNRLSSDSEITALKAGGISVWQLFPPVLILGIINMIFTGFLSLYLVPRARGLTEQLLFNIARSNARAAIRVKSFREITPGLTIYVDAMNGDILEGILISDTGMEKRVAPEDADEVYVIASEGKLVSDPKEFSNYLSLKNGSIHVTNNQGDVYRKIDYGQYDLRIDIKEKEKKKIERGSEFEVMDITTLLAKRAEYRRKYREALESGEPEYEIKAKAFKTALAQIGIAYHQKFSLPFACIILALWGIPLGIQPPRATRYQGIVVSIGLSLIYYLMVSGGRVMATRFSLDPVIMAWFPNVLVLCTGVVFFHRATRDRPLPLANLISRVTEVAEKAASYLRLRRSA